MVESALASTVLLVLLFGIIEMGFLFRDYLTVRDTADLASSQASIYGSSSFSDPNGDTSLQEVNADFVALTTILNSTSIVGDNIERVVIWKAEPRGPLSTPPTICLQSELSFVNETIIEDGEGVEVRCNIYGNSGLYAAQNNNTYYFSCDIDNPVQPACGWPPSERGDSIGSESIDYIGVYVQMKHNFRIGVISDSMTLTSYSVKRLEVRRGQSEQVS